VLLEGGAAFEAADCTFENGAFGLSGSGRHEIRLESCLFGGNRGRAVSLEGASLLTARRCVFEKNSAGISAAGGGVLVFDGCSFSGNRGPGVEINGRNSLLVRDCSFKGGESGIEGLGPNRVEIESSAFSGITGPAAELELPVLLDAARCVISGNGSGFDLKACRLLKGGELRFEGNAGHALSADGAGEILLDGSTFSRNGAGLNLKACRLLKGRGLRFEGNAGPALWADGAGEILLDGSTFSRNGAGLNLKACRLLKGSGLSFEGNAGHALRADGAGELFLDGADFRGNKAGLDLRLFRLLKGSGLSFEDNTGPAVRADGAGRVLLSGSGFRGNGSGLSLRGDVEASLADCAFERQAGTDVLYSGRTRGKLSACVFRAGGSALEISGTASVSGEKCLFEENGGPAAEVSGRAELRLSDCRSSGENPSLLMRGDAAGSFSRVFARSGSFPALSAAGRARVSAAGCSFSSAADAVYFRSSGSAEFRGCRLASGEGAGLNLRSGEAGLRDCSLEGRGGILAASRSAVKLRDVEIKSAAYGIDSSAASFSAAGLNLRGGTLGGILFSEGVNRLKDCSVEEAPYPGISVAEGAALAFDGIVFSGRPWLRAKPPSDRPSLKKPLFRFVAATASRPLFGAVYRRIYLTALPAARLLLRGPGLRALYLYRGMAGKGWVPGLSDMDLACVLEAAPPGADYSAYSALRRRLRLLKLLFPFTGELMLSTEGDFTAFLNCWGVKGAEFPGASRLLYGRAVKVSPGPQGAGAADTTEAFYAYTLLLRQFFSEGLPEPFLRRNCVKNLVDIRRYLDASSPERYSRAAYAAANGLPLENFMSLKGTEAAYQAFRALHAAAPPAPGGGASSADWGPARPPAGASPRGWFNRSAFDAVCRGMAQSSGVGLGVALDSLYRVYLVLPDDSAGDKAAYLRACGALREARSVSPALSASPLVLTRSSFALLARLPYLNNPMFWADLAAPAAGGSGPEDGGVYCYDLAPVFPAPPAGAARRAALPAARHFCASWRSLWEEMPPHYFYTRTAGLRLLLETGGSPEFSARDLLRETLLKRTGAELPAWRDYLAGGSGRANYEYISSQAAVLGRLADAG
ncbi:MAG: right-handed parallel beta-helix repeat-containing protein, partial [Elusimicrobia bacterium]|nr:right-handed parallel beta-helix repeat-containing protein [Elusimicrobiota bacterium]